MESLELKNKISEVQYSLHRLKIRLETTENISELEDK